MKRKHAYLAVYVGIEPDFQDRVKLRLWDMLRYDQCFPMSEYRFPEWLIFARPFRTGDYSTEFTVDRWKSFGFGEVEGTLVLGYSPASEGLRIPIEMADSLSYFAAVKQ